MKAISVRQPWAGAIVSGWKPVENRTRMFHHRGLLLIHAGQQLADDYNDAERTILDHAHQTVPLLGTPGGPTQWALGAVIGVVDLRAAHRGCDGSCAPGWAQPDQVHHMVTAGQILTRPVPAMGRLGVWTPDDEVLDQVKDAWPR